MAARKNFDMELEELNLDLIRMGSMVEEAIERSISAFKHQDADVATEIIDHDHEINEIEKKIESKCLTLILRQQPVASDLRKISTALKMITDMERIGDNAADIAELSMQITGENPYAMLTDIPIMAETVIEMVHDSITSFVNNDLVQAKEVIKRDDVVDGLFDKIKDQLIEMLKDPNENRDNTIDYLMIAKYLERIADHAVNICEWVQFLETGQHNNVQIL